MDLNKSYWRDDNINANGHFGNNKKKQPKQSISLSIPGTHLGSCKLANSKPYVRAFEAKIKDQIICMKLQLDRYELHKAQTNRARCPAVKCARAPKGGIRPHRMRLRNESLWLACKSMLVSSTCLPPLIPITLAPTCKSCRLLLGMKVGSPSPTPQKFPTFTIPCERERRRRNPNFLHIITPH